MTQPERLGYAKFRMKRKLIYTRRKSLCDVDIGLPHQVRHVSLHDLALDLERLDALDEQVVAVELSGALDVEDEVVAHAAQLDLVPELVVAQHLARDRVVERVDDDGLLLAGVRGQRRVGGGLVVRDGHLVDDARREAARELLGVRADDGRGDGDVRQQAVGGGGDGRELGVVGADALDAMHREVDGLAGAQLCDQDVRVDGLDGVLAGEELGLAAGGDELDLVRVDYGITLVFSKGCLCGLERAYRLS